MQIENKSGETVNIPPDLQYTVDKNVQAGNTEVVDNIVAQIDTLKNKSVSAIWQEKTGQSWAQAKAQGLTDGSYEANIKLKSALIEGKFDKRAPAQEPSSSSSPNSSKSYADASSFKEAFQLARQQLGPNKIFEWQDRKYGTNVAGEKFTPSKEDLQKFNLNKPEVIKRLDNQNKLVESPYSKKEVTKLEPEYKNWETIKERNKEINKLDDASKIVSYQSDKDEQYLIVDKKAARMHLYKGDKKIDSFEVGVGQNKSDAQTVTKVRDGKVDWAAGNMSTGAGMYKVSAATESNPDYYGEPSFNLVNEQGIEVATSIHGTPKGRRANFKNNNVEDNRMTSGCINGICTDLKSLYSKHKIREGVKVYVLPEEEGNTVDYQDGKIVFRTSAENRKKALSYTDSKGEVQKGQGINTTKNTLAYKPIKTFIDKPSFEKDVFQWNDLNDETEYTTTTEPFANSLAKNKQKVMQAAKIPSDVYNEIARITFGIYGTESNFGDTHSAVGNLARAVQKSMSPRTSSSPDYESKASTYRATGENNSVGLTQIRFSYLNMDEKKALADVGITKNTDFLDPEKAAMGTAIVLGVRYNQQLKPSEKEDIWAHLPTKWNRRSNYSDRVKQNSKYLAIKQLD